MIEYVWIGNLHSCFSFLNVVLFLVIPLCHKRDLRDEPRSVCWRPGEGGGPYYNIAKCLLPPVYWLSHLLEIVKQCCYWSNSGTVVPPVPLWFKKLLKRDTSSGYPKGTGAPIRIVVSYRCTYKVFRIQSHTLSLDIVGLYGPVCCLCCLFTSSSESPHWLYSLLPSLISIFTWQSGLERREAF